MLPKRAIEEFKKIYKQKFKEDLSNAEASRRANALLNLYEVIYGLASFGRQKEEETKKIK